MASAKSDVTLIELHQKGDMNAIDELIQRHQKRAYQYAYRLTHDRDAAADLVADAFLRVYRSVKDFKGQSAFTTWLFRVITNCFLDTRKKAHYRLTTSLDGVLETPSGELRRQVPDTDENPFECVDRRMRTDILAGAIQSLPDAHRSIVTMFHGEMLSYEEIAETLTVPIGTVKSRLNRARGALASELTPYREELLAA